MLDQLALKGIRWPACLWCVRSRFETVFIKLIYIYIYLAGPFADGVLDQSTFVCMLYVEENEYDSYWRRQPASSGFNDSHVIIFDVHRFRSSQTQTKTSARWISRYCYWVHVGQR